MPELETSSESSTELLTRIVEYLTAKYKFENTIPVIPLSEIKIYYEALMGMKGASDKIQQKKTMSADDFQLYLQEKFKQSVVCIKVIEPTSETEEFLEKLLTFLRQNEIKFTKSHKDVYTYRLENLKKKENLTAGEKSTMEFLVKIGFAVEMI